MALDVFALVRRLGPLLRLGAEYVAANLGTRILAAVSGLMLVRWMPVAEYGFYTLALTAFTFMCTFSDMGATGSLAYFKHRAIRKRGRWPVYLKAVLQFRRATFCVAFIISALYLQQASSRIGVEWQRTWSMIFLLGVGAWWAIQASVQTYALTLEQRFRLAYAVELSNEGAKLVFVCLAWVAGLISALTGLIGVALGSAVAALLARRLQNTEPANPVKKTVKTTGRQVRAMKSVLFGQIGPVLPGVLYFALQGPLVAWLAAYFGSASNVAEVGALGRLAIIIGLMAGFTGSVLIPRLIAIDNQALFLRRYLHCWLVILSATTAIMICVLAFPDAVLWLLGSEYTQLRSELVVSTGIAIIANWGAFAWQINRARGWVKLQIYRVPAIMAAQLITFGMIDFSTTQGVLFFALVTAAADALFQTLLNGLGFCAVNNERKGSTCLKS